MTDEFLQSLLFFLELAWLVLAAVPETAPPGAPLLRLKVSDRDEGRNAQVYIEIVGGNEGGEFSVNAETGVLYTARALDAERAPLHHLTVAAIDQGNVGTRKQSSAKVTITVLDANDNEPVFEHAELRVTVPENGPAGAVVARVAARDADSGDNAYVSYSLANLRPAPFDVDPFTGAVRTTRTLDYESMRREWELRVRASDWGAPYRRQAEMRLVVRLEDVNDNRPQFERVECVAHVPRRAALGAELATLSAIDMDAGDVVNESVALGTSLVRLRARDRDLGYNGLITYGISGGDPHSLFRVEPASGELQVIGYLDREREGEYYLNVSAWDQGRPPRAASRLLPVTVLDVNDNPPRFERALASFRVTENAINGTVVFRANATDRDSGEFAHLTEWETWKVTDYSYEQLFGKEISSPLDSKLRALIYSPHAVASKVHDLSYHEFMSTIRELKAQGKLTNRDKTSKILRNESGQQQSAISACSTPLLREVTNKNSSDLDVRASAAAKRRSEERGASPPTETTGWDPILAQQGTDCQRLGTDTWKNIRYSEVQKQFQATPTFSALKVNNLFAGITPNWTSVALLEKMDLILGAITNGLLQQRKIFENLCDELPQDFKQRVGQEFLASNSKFRINSDALLQYVCGRRAEVLQQMRHTFKVKNKAFHEIMLWMIS
ncbi:Fat-like cadherin-related tumor suppressor-like protein [Operophtera brumata]|uniref:Fat-like cadherin-related tumor suppressor-like protein n=1 Tax=Operophtera brumata TaxID=104452 RepID=A0A0L7KX56_OPEBR|nr:Fat-like cadherin-related tumor suppressor-like protein [Operophtera brumata]